MSGSLPRNHQTAILIGFLVEHLNFVVELKGEQWVAVRHSGMHKQTVILPDDTLILPEEVNYNFQQQTIEMRDEIRRVIDELRGQLDDMTPKD